MTNTRGSWRGTAEDDAGAAQDDVDELIAAFTINGSGGQDKDFGGGGAGVAAGSD